MVMNATDQSDCIVGIFRNLLRDFWSQRRMENFSMCLQETFLIDLIWLYALNFLTFLLFFEHQIVFFPQIFFLINFTVSNAFYAFKIKHLMLKIVYLGL